MFATISWREKSNKKEKMNKNNNLHDLPFTSVTIIGLGLIGASLAAALKKRYPDMGVFGIDTDAKTRETAMKRHWVNDAFAPNDKTVESLLLNDNDSQLVVIATPVAAVDEYLRLLKAVDFKGIVTDTLSTKFHILNAAAEMLPYPNNYIPGHPMTGSEKSGIDGARVDLFEGTNWILCPGEVTSPEQFKKLHELICSLDARVVSIQPEEHDRAVAVVSHVPHIVASALVHLASHHADDSQAIMRLAAGGFKDTTRVAAGSPELWCGIAFDNSEALTNGLNEISEILLDFSSALKNDNRAGFTELLTDAAEVRRNLPAEWVPSSDRLVEVRIPMVNKTGPIAEVTTIASSVGCNIQSIEIDHISEGNAVLSLILTDEGDLGQLSCQLIDAGYSVSLNPISPKEHTHV